MAPPDVMVLIAVLIAALTSVIVVVRALRRRRTRWGVIFAAGLALGIVRAALVTWGWYTVENTGGPLQVPAYLLSVLACRR